MKPKGVLILVLGKSVQEIRAKLLEELKAIESYIESGSDQVSCIGDGIDWEFIHNKKIGCIQDVVDRRVKERVKRRVLKNGKRR